MKTTSLYNKNYKKCKKHLKLTEILIGSDRKGNYLQYIFFVVIIFSDFIFQEILCKNLQIKLDLYHSAHKYKKKSH